MAQLDIREAQDGIQEAIRQLQKADLFTDENLKPILSTGTEIMLSSVKSAFVQAGHNNRSERRTGQTFQHFTKARKVSRDKRGVPYMYVTISGKDSRGQRYGTKGFVTDVIKDLQYTFFYTCGPEPMFRAMHKIMKTPGQYSFEERMGCGFGACMGCSCKTLTGNKRICKEGPVMESEEIIWAD